MAESKQSRVASICAECGAPVHFVLGTGQVRCGHCDSGLVVERGERLVRLACPACGGDFYYLDGSLSGTCPYCSKPLLATALHRVLRYVFPPAERPATIPPDARLWLLPFWHLSGLLYVWDIGSRVTVEADIGPQPPREAGEAALPTTTVRDSGPQKSFRGRVVDFTVADPAAEALGITTLRLRAAVFPMEPCTAAHEELGHLVPPVWEVDEVREQLVTRAHDAGRTPDTLTRVPCQRLDLVSEALELFSYPFWIRPPAPGREAQAWDGINGEPEPMQAADRSDPVPAPRTGLYDSLHIMELACPSCGEPVSGGNHSVMFPCTACGDFSIPSADGLQQCSGHYAAVRTSPRGEDDDFLVWLPFWKVPTAVSYCGRRASTVGDLLAVLGITPPRRGDVATAPTDAPLSCYVPAYGSMRAPRIDAAARDLTLLQPDLEPGPTAADELYHCFFEPGDARRLVYACWLHVLKGAAIPRMRSLRITAEQPELWYVPFEDRGRELTNLVTGLRYDRAALKGLRH